MAIYKSPLEQAKVLTPQYSPVNNDDELASFLDDLYENKLKEDKELDLGNGRIAYYSKASDPYNADYEVDIVEGDNVVDNWTDFYPKKKAREESKLAEIRRLRGIK